MLVANTEKKHVVEVPLEPSGAPGDPRIFYSFGATDYLDGIAADVVGNAYVLVAGRSELVRITPAGEATTVAAADDGLNVPASLAFGTRSTAHRTLYVTNFSLPIFTPAPTPGVLGFRRATPRSAAAVRVSSPCHRATSTEISLSGTGQGSKAIRLSQAGPTGPCRSASATAWRKGPVRAGSCRNDRF